MTLFWVLAGVMLLVALLFTLPGLLYAPRVSETDMDTVNIEVIKAQLAELEADLENGRLEETQYRAAREDLERELLADLSATPIKAAAVEPHGGRWAAWLLLVLIPVLTIGLYQSIGTHQIIPLLDEGLATRQAANPAADAASFADMVEKLAARLRDEPDNAEGWLMLGRSYKTLQRFDDAMIAYARAQQLYGDNAGLLTEYVDTLVMANGGRFSAQAGGMLLKALEIEPDNLKALWLAGHWKYQQGEYAEAVRDWQRAAVQLPEGSEDARLIAQQISQAQQLAPSAAMNAPATPQAAAANKSITVRITLDPQLAAAAAPGDTVFIFARALSGPRMPLAIVRKQVRDLPVTVTLDDATAMAPALKLSGFDAVTVGARITRSGQAMPQSGDLQGRVSPVVPGAAKPVALIIDHRVP